MTPVDAHRIPNVPMEQLALDQTLKHLRKLRWIGKEIEAEKILQALGDRRLPPPALGREVPEPLAE